MYKEITIGSKKVGMLANGASPVLFYKVFKQDILKALNVKNGDISSDFMMKMAYIMAKQGDDAKPSELSRKLTEDDFLDWCEQFESMDLLMALGEAMELFTESAVTKSSPKAGGE